MAQYWQPLGAQRTTIANFIFVGLLLLLILGFFGLLVRQYARILKWCLGHKKTFLIFPVLIILLGLTIWLGFARVFSPLNYGFESLGVSLNTNKTWSGLSHTFPGIGEEFMPSLDEGSFLLMPTSMPHAGIEHDVHLNSSCNTGAVADQRRMGQYLDCVNPLSDKFRR